MSEQAPSDLEQAMAYGGDGLVSQAPYMLRALCDEAVRIGAKNFDQLKKDHFFRAIHELQLALGKEA